MTILGQPLKQNFIKNIVNMLREERKWTHKNVQLKPQKADRKSRKKWRE